MDTKDDRKDNKNLAPEMLSAVQAGFASAANEYIERHLDLNELVVKQPEATFFVRVQGDSMVEAGIQTGDILVVDRSKEALHGKIVIAIVNGEFTVKKLHIDERGLFLVASNKRYKPIKIDPESDFSVWGVVTYVISPR